jgi:uncharacterized protein YcbK (DUF882 family)
MNRRTALRLGGAAALTGAVAYVFSPTAAATTSAEPRRVSFYNLHTGDRFSDAYWEQGDYVPDAMAAIRHVLRDFRTNDAHDIDPRLLDQLHQLNGLIGAAAPYQIISGYRSPATNAMLHANSDGVATHSLHMEGRAIDIRMAGVDLTRLHDAALSMHAGGVGFYPASDFVHVDTGRVRRW